MTTESGAVDPRELVTVTCESSELDDLFFDWIDAIVFEMSTRHMLFGRFDVEIEGPHLEGRLWGERVDRKRHEPAVEIKGPTYTELHVLRDVATGLWSAQCVVDV